MRTAAAALGLLLAGAPAAPAAPAPGPIEAGALAAAQGIRTSLTMPGFLLVESVFDGGGPVAQSVVDPAGGAGFASLPYPGETAMSVPGLVAAGGGPALPAYPLYVRAGSSQPDQSVSDPAGLYALRAVVSANGATADARLGSHGQAVVSGGQTHTEVSRSAEAVTASAESITEGIVVAEGALTIASVRSRSRTVLPRVGEVSGPGGPQTGTELVVEGGRAGPLSFSYGPGGLVVDGGPVPIPAGDGLAALNRALAPAGVALGIARGEDVAGGRSSDVLVVEAQVPVPGGRPGLLRFRIGGTVTAVGGAPLAADLGEGVPPDPLPPLPAPNVAPGEQAGDVAVAGRSAVAPEPDPGPAAPPAEQLALGSAELGAGVSSLENPAAPATGQRAAGLGAANVGVVGLRVTGLRIAYGALAAVLGGLVFGSWWWRRGVSRP